jgi:hypothetical protein
MPKKTFQFYAPNNNENKNCNQEEGKKSRMDIMEGHTGQVDSAIRVPLPRPYAGVTSVDWAVDRTGELINVFKVVFPTVESVQKLTEDMIDYLQRKKPKPDWLVCRDFPKDLEMINRLHFSDGGTVPLGRAVTIFATASANPRENQAYTRTKNIVGVWQHGNTERVPLPKDYAGIPSVPWNAKRYGYLVGLFHVTFPTKESVQVYVEDMIDYFQGRSEIPPWLGSQDYPKDLKSIDMLHFDNGDTVPLNTVVMIYATTTARPRAMHEDTGVSRIMNTNIGTQSGSDDVKFSRVVK